MKLTELKPPIIIAHRGYCRRYPENTLSAFAAAFEAGAQMIELDVSLTKDGQLVVIHDATVNRTTNGRGPVKSYTLEELKRLDAGAWFHRRFSGERIPALADVFDRFAPAGLVNVEIKSHPNLNRQDIDFLRGQVAAAIRQTGLKDRVLVSSFDTDVLEKMAEMTDPPFTALLSSRYEGPREVDLCRRLGVLAWHPNYRRLKAAHVHMMHAAGILVFPYTVNFRGDARRLLRLEVDGLFSDDPRLLKACLAD
jgi:glycerophosphoryl diester phosphodiesterase